MHMRNGIAACCAMLAVASIPVVLGASTPTYGPGGIDGMIDLECLEEASFTLYGKQHCAECETQKTLLGEDAENVEYVDCTVEPERCAEDGITTFPTRVDGDGNKHSGKTTTADLGRLSKCIKGNKMDESLTKILAAVELL